MHTKSTCIAAFVGVVAIIANSGIWFHAGFWLGSSGARTNEQTPDESVDPVRSLETPEPRTPPILPAPEIREIMD